MIAASLRRCTSGGDGAGDSQRSQFLRSIAEDFNFRDKCLFCGKGPSEDFFKNRNDFLSMKGIQPIKSRH